LQSLDELRDWLDSMRGRTCRAFAITGSTPAGWHVLLPDGEFGFLDVKLPTSTEEHTLLVKHARGYMRDMQVHACLFVAEKELADGRPVLVLQHEAVDSRGQRHRAVELLRIVAAPEGRAVDIGAAVVPETARDLQLASSGLFPDLLADPPSPLRIL
jgi:hypothetical protein